MNKKHPFANEHLQPVFLKEMEFTEEWRVFEHFTHYLLKGVGINSLHTFPLTHNKGKADGLFTIKDLYVIYDATLNQNFLEGKREQIQKYILKLKRQRTVSVNKQQFALKGVQKQIWLITRGEAVRQLFSESSGAVIVKEVPFYKLAEIYYKRLHENLNEHCLCDLLKNLR